MKDKRVLLFALFLMGLTSGTPAQEEGGVSVLGAGLNSCGWMLASDANRTEGLTWALGYWSGANIWGDNRRVGMSTDTYGIVAEIERRCAEDPTERLFGVISALYATMKEQGL